MIQRNAGSASVTSESSISLIGDIINRPTMIRAGAVAAPGITRNNGDKNMARKKRIAAARKNQKQMRYENRKVN